ncbi:phosphatidylinositol-3-phosphatase ymr1 [Coemansia sp. Cherry 401B]|nr:phosphatidylinositol-3-phosphatase ymr1 [Coemansia sp. RSA 2705]KAJ2318567.1 phosphatidylinositol-3-phosphatase ymr1 [Coemansia sp. RSA 2704]KAJ2365901.1 phosphatidylinositol-3-phosphatase ymr1 [Coemansia sp. RSA 2610]KAJ2734837.1 phosphatidylinositol-3-phosphatase ymr1 [Coemansia sp. Cherry 401B]
MEHTHTRATTVEQVRLVRSGHSTEYLGTLQLTAHHLTFTADTLELRIGYPQIHSAVLLRPPRLARRDSEQNARTYSAEELAAWALEGAISMRCHHFLFVTLRCVDVRALYDVFATVKQRACVASLAQLYAFDYGHSESGFDMRREFERQGVGAEGAGRFWRLSEINGGFQLCATYPALVGVPAKISDTTLTYAARYRSKGRLPVLSYLHANGASMTRASQPMVGLKQARSVQDEKLVEAILATSEPDGTPPRFKYEREHIIIDARPTTNAVANRAVGAGSENMDHYRRCRKEYLGIDNIHVMRDSLNKLAESLQHAPSAGVVARIQGSKSAWLGHIENILVGARSIVEAIDAGRHVLVHCSDGWDRTAQLTSLAQLCLDPHFRTLAGFATLVEKEWVAFGHQFTLRCGHLGHADRFRVTRASRRRSSSGGDSTSNVSSEPRDEPDPEDPAPPGLDALLQSGTTMFGRFASRALRGVQSRISSAIQAASDNLDDPDDVDPFFAEYPELQPDYMAPDAAATPQRRSNGFRLGRAKHDHETSPVFQQFLDCVFQLWVQHPTMFEFNERFLLDLFYHLHTAQFGTFLANNMKERAALGLAQRTASVWAWVRGRESEYKNPLYQGDASKRAVRVIVPNPKFVQYWSALFAGCDPAFAGECGSSGGSCGSSGVSCGSSSHARDALSLPPSSSSSAVVVAAGKEEESPTDSSNSTPPIDKLSIDDPLLSSNIWASSS